MSDVTDEDIKQWFDSRTPFFDGENNISAGQGVEITDEGVWGYDFNEQGVLVKQAGFGTDGKWIAGAGRVIADEDGLRTYDKNYEEEDATEQINISTDGKLTAGGGAIKVDKEGISSFNQQGDKTFELTNNGEWVDNDGSIVISSDGHFLGRKTIAYGRVDFPDAEHEITVGKFVEVPPNKRWVVELEPWGDAISNFESYINDGYDLIGLGSAHRASFVVNGTSLSGLSPGVHFLEALSLEAYLELYLKIIEDNVQDIVRRPYSRVTWRIIEFKESDGVNDIPEL